MWMIVMCAIIAGVILLDQISKVLIVAYLYEGQKVLIPGLLQFTYVENEGMAFGLLSDHRWVFILLSTVGILALGYYLFRYAKTTLFRVALSLIVGGGIGNMIDRIARGFVVDFIDFCAFPDLWYWVFNIADAAVTVGGVIFAIGLIFELVAEYKNKENLPAGGATANKGKTAGEAANAGTGEAAKNAGEAAKAGAGEAAKAGAGEAANADVGEAAKNVGEAAKAGAGEAANAGVGEAAKNVGEAAKTTDAGETADGEVQDGSGAGDGKKS